MGWGLIIQRQGANPLGLIVQGASCPDTALNGSYYTSRATSGAGRNDRNTSGQRENKFNTSYRDISVVVAESNSVVKPKCEQYTSLNKM